MNKKTLLLFWRSASKYRFRLWTAILGAALTVTVASFLGPYIFSQLLEIIQGGNATIENSWKLVAMYAATQIYGEFIGWRINLFMVWTFETAAQRDLHKRIFEKLINHSMDFHANRFGGALVSQSTKLIGAFERFWDTVIFQFMPSLTSIIAGISILSFVFWQYAVVLTFLAIIFIVIVMLGSRVMAEKTRTESQANTKINARLADAVTNVIAIKANGQEAVELEEFGRITKHWRGKSLQTMKSFLVVSSGYSVMIAILNTSAVVSAVLASQYNLVSIGIVYLCVAYTLTISRQLWEFNNIMRNYNRVMGDAHDMVEILNLPVQIEDPKHPQKPHILRGTIEFKDVTFGYTKADPIFKGLNLKIKSGEKVGLVGHSGGGKTTITKLIMRFVDITRGKIMIDGQDISRLKQSDLRSNISYVPQEPLLFHRSLAENITYGQAEASKEQIRAVAKMAHADEFIRELPDGYETLVGERGVKLSGGQRQRIAIARAILKNAPILVLDEATSALDSESEALIQDALWKLMEGRTAIVIAHRLSTIQRMDRIIVMEKGRIAEQGTHKELIRQNGIYAKLWSRQSGGFIDE